MYKYNMTLNIVKIGNYFRLITNNMISCIKNINEKKIVKTIKDTNLIFGV